MATISAQLVKQLRDQTGAGFMDCKVALQETGGDLEKAIDWLRTKGMAKAQRRAGRATSEGRICSYIHPGDKIGVLIEVDCESDFVARTDDFKTLCHDLALHIAAAEPRYVAREEVTPEILERERNVYLGQARQTGKPEKVIEKIVDGKMEKFYEEACLLEQHFIKDDKMTVKQLVHGAVARMGENILVRRFVRFKLGDATLAAETAPADPDDGQK